MIRIKAGKNKEKIVQGLLTLLGTYGVCCLGNHAGLTAASFSVVSIPLAATVFWLLSRTGKNLEAVPEGSVLITSLSTVSDAIKGKGGTVITQ